MQNFYRSLGAKIYSYVVPLAISKRMPVVEVDYCPVGFLHSYPIILKLAVTFKEDVRARFPIEIPTVVHLPILLIFVVPSCHFTVSAVACPSSSDFRYPNPLSACSLFHHIGTENVTVCALATSFKGYVSWIRTLNFLSIMYLKSSSA